MGKTPEAQAADQAYKTKKLTDLQKDLFRFAERSKKEIKVFETAVKKGDKILETVCEYHPDVIKMANKAYYRIIQDLHQFSDSIDEVERHMKNMS